MTERYCPLLEFKALDDQTGIFEGYLSVFGNVDSQKDIVDSGAFTKTLQEREIKRQRLGKPYLVPILWQHKPDEPIGGFLAMQEDAKGLYVKGQLDLNIAQGQRAYSGLKMGYISGLSIGYRTIKDQYSKDARHLKEVALNEGSVVTFPSNDDANVLGVKSAAGATDLPIAARNRAWDAGAATGRIEAWAKTDQGLDAAKLRQVFFWVDPDKADQIGGYKFPFADIIGGKPTAIPNAIFNGAARLDSASIPDADRKAIQGKMGAYYDRMRKQFKNPSLKAPWDSKASVMPSMSPLDFGTRLAQLDESDDLQDQWGDASVALIQTLYGIMCGAMYPDPDQPVDPVQAVGDACDAFKDVVTKLAARSVQLHFVPMLDDDGDSFYDPDGPNADDEDAGYMADQSMIEAKAGRMFSAASATKMQKAMGHMQDAMESCKSASSHIQDLLDANNKYEPGGTPTQKQTEPGAGANDGATTPEDEQALLELFSAMLADTRASKQPKA